MLLKKITKKLPQISIIITCFNGQKYIKNCLDSIFNSTEKKVELICIDDCSVDQSLATFKQYPHYFKIIANKNNLGASLSRNLGAKLAKAPILLFLDIDTVIDSHCLKNILSFFKVNPSKTAIQIGLLNPDKKSYESTGHFISPFGYPYEIGLNRKVKSVDSNFPIFGGRSAGLAIPQKLFKQIGGFDPDYQIYGEDTDLCWRIWLQGAKVYFLPEAKAVHFQKSTLTEQNYQRIFSQGVKNNLNYLIKNLDLKRYGYVLILFLLATFLLALKQFCCARFKYAWDILQAINWNLVNLKLTLTKRRPNIFLTKEIIFGDLNLKNIFFKAWRWLKIV